MGTGFSMYWMHGARMQLPIRSRIGVRGNPERDDASHCHSVTSCLEDNGKGHSKLVGYAFDEFGIYGHRGEQGKVLINGDLAVYHEL
jgi:hypothetical protein